MYCINFFQRFKIASQDCCRKNVGTDIYFLYKNGGMKCGYFNHHSVTKSQLTFRYCQPLGGVTYPVYLANGKNRYNTYQGSSWKKGQWENPPRNHLKLKCREINLFYVRDIQPICSTLSRSKSGYCFVQNFKTIAWIVAEEANVDRWDFMRFHINSLATGGCSSSFRRMIFKRFIQNIITGFGNGLMPSGNKPLPEPVFTQIYVSI